MTRQRRLCPLRRQREAVGYPSGFRGIRTGGGWYYQTVTDVIDNDGDMFEVLDVLVRDVGILGIFSDWPATVTYYANCMGMK